MYLGSEGAAPSQLWALQNSYPEWVPGGGGGEISPVCCMSE